MKFGVCMVAVYFYPDIGGIQMYVLALAKKLRALGVDVFIVTRRSQDVPLYEEIQGVPVYRLDIPRETPKAIAAVRFLLEGLRQLGLLNHQFDIIHTHQLVTPTTIGLIARDWLGKKLVATPHTPTTSGAEQSLVYNRPLTGKPRLFWMRQRIDAFVAISQEIEQDLLNVFKFPREKILYIANGVDTDRFAPLSPQEKIKHRQNLGLEEGPTLIFAGRLIARKQVDVLMRAFAGLLPKLAPTAQLLIVGDGEERQNLENLAQELDISTRVKFVGIALNVETYLQASDVSILPSNSEGMPIALLEAMACGLPCIGSDIGGIVDLIQTEVNGLVTPSGDVLGLQHTLERILFDPDLANRLGQAARQNILENYSIESAAKNHLALYEKLLNQDQ